MQGDCAEVTQDPSRVPYRRLVSRQMAESVTRKRIGTPECAVEGIPVTAGA